MSERSVCADICAQWSQIWERKPPAMPPCEASAIFYRTQRAKPLKTWKPQSTRAHAVFKMAIGLLITALCLSQTHTHLNASGCTWDHFISRVTKATRQTKQLLQQFCIITSIWRPHTKSGRQKTINSLTVCFPVSLSHLFLFFSFFFFNLAGLSQCSVLLRVAQSVSCYSNKSVEASWHVIKY